MIMHRDGQRFFGMVLADAMTIQMPFDIAGLWHGKLGNGLFVLSRKLLVQDAFAESDAIVANVNARTGDQLFDLGMGLPAKAAKGDVSGPGHGFPQGIFSSSF
jgi:hypothetical protein